MQANKRGSARVALFALAGAVTLAACSQTNVAQRRIQLAGASGGGELNRKIEQLLNRTNTSYVTLGVFDRSTRETQEASVPDEIATSGSGFVIDERLGLVVTAAHVAITTGWTIKARGADGRFYKGRVITTLPRQDTALLQFATPRGLTRVQPAKSACLRPGAPVFSLGKPSKKGDTARLGTIASMSFGRPVRYQGYGYKDAMVIRMKTEKGESGGPLFDEHGQLVGMVVSTVTDNNGKPLGLAHAITLPQLATAICSRIDCSPAWRAHVNNAPLNCAAS